MTDQSSFEVPGLIITPAHGQLTIPKGFRLYPANACYSCDPLTYILEGRLNNTAPWILIASGEIPGVADGLTRNSGSDEIQSTYESGDPAFSYTSIAYPNNADAYLDYRLSFPETRAPMSNSTKFFPCCVFVIMICLQELIIYSLSAMAGD